MLRTFLTRFRCLAPPPALPHFSPGCALRSVTGDNAMDNAQALDMCTPEQLNAMPYFHHKKRPRFRDYIKVKAPRKKASKLLLDLSRESIENSKAAKPEVFKIAFASGDAIECEIIEQGGVGSTELKKVRGVVIGKCNKGLDSSVLIRDVVMGMHIERLLPLHSPLVKTIWFLGKNFVYKGKRKVKRSKLYFMRDRNPNEYKVTKGKP